MQHIRTGLLLAMLTVGGAAGAAAQRPIELGLDAGVMFSLDDPKTTVFSVPIQGFRVGFFLSDRISFEPAVAFNWIKPSGEDAFSTLALDAGLLVHLSPSTSGSQVYVRPVAGVSRFSGGGESASQFNIGGGLGVKLPLADRLKLRLEGSLRHALDSDDLASGTALGLTIGFSFLTR